MNKRIVSSLSLTSTFLLMLTSCANNYNSSNDSQSSYDSSSSIEEKDNTVQVIILLGQSNMEGHTYSMYLSKTAPDKVNEYVNGYDDVQISFHNSGDYSSLNQFTKVKLGQGKTENHFGPEIGIAEKMVEANKKNVYLIKYACGATSLSGHWISPSSRNNTPGGVMYQGAVEYILDSIKQLESLDLYPEIKAICWMQGEDDSNGSEYNNYYTYTKNFVHDLREDLKLYMGLNGIGFLDAAIANNDVWKEHDIINDAKKRNAEEDELSIFIDTNEAMLTTNHEPIGAIDVYHYDSDSMIKLGHLFGDALLKYFID